MNRRITAVAVVLVAGFCCALCGATRAVADVNAPASTWAVSGPTLPGIDTAQVNTMVVSGTTAYIGGTFTSVGPDTGSFVGFDTSSGALSSGWPVMNGPVLDSISDGSGGWY